ARDRRPDPIAGLDRVRLHGGDRISVEGLSDHRTALRLFRSTENRAGLRVPNLSALTKHFERQAHLCPRFPPYRNRHRSPLGLDDVAGELREHPNRLIDERGDRERCGTRWGIWGLALRRAANQNRKDRGSENSDCTRHGADYITKDDGARE